MDTSEEQTDERKAERLSYVPQSSSVTQITSSQSQPLLADTVLRHSPTTARLLRSLCSRGSGLVRPSLIHTQLGNDNNNIQSSLFIITLINWNTLKL